MRIFGDFKDLHNNLIHVEIYKQETGVATNYEIDNILDDRHHFCFDGKSPVKITRKFDDLFEPIVSTTCKIKLRSNIWCGDLLFSNGVGDIICKVTRTLNDGTNDEKLLFIGYVQPLSLNQNINKMSNIIDINCVDILGFFKDRYLSTGLTGSQSESAWQSAISNAQYRKFIDIFKYIGLYDHTFTMYDTSYSTKLYIDDNGKNMTANTLQLSDNLWLGDGADNESSLYDILLEVMRYMNCRIISTNGQDFYIIGNDEIGSVSNFKLYSNNTSTDIEFDDDNILPKEDIANEQVTMDSCYNKISVKCNLESVDDVVENPLKEDLLTSPYINRQLMLREYIGDFKVGDYDIYHNFCHMVLDNGFQNVNTDKVRYKDWYFRYLDNSNWIYNNRMKDNTYLPEMPYIEGTSYVWQCRLLHDLGYVMQHPTAGASEIARPYGNSLGGAYFVGIGSTDYYDKNSNSPKSVSLTNYLVIPVKGLDRGNTEEDESAALAEYATLLQPYNTDPMISYSSNKTLNFSPSDSQTTNYIIINGKLRCMPVYQTHEDKGRAMGLLHEWTRLYSGVREDMQDDLDEGDVMPPKLPVGTNGRRGYYARFFDLKDPNMTINMNSTAVPPNVNRYGTALMFPPQDVNDLYKFQYRYNIISSTSGSYHDSVTHVPILCCRLYVTRADGKRKYVQQDYETFAFSWTGWVDSSDVTFCISINPDIDDYIIGPEHEITNTVTPAMNLASSGLAIPIKQSDDVSGNLTIEILGPYNTQYDDVNKRTHSKWTQFWRGENPEDWTSTPRCLLDRISNIFISKFEITVDSDNAKNATLNSGDLVYYSEDTMKYTNTQDIDFKIVTALTSDEAAEMNVATGISYNNPTLLSGNLYTTSYQNRPEYRYIYTMYRLASTPKKIIEYNCNLDNNDIGEMYRSVYSCDLMSHLNISNFSTIVMSNELDLKNDRQKINLREI